MPANHAEVLLAAQLRAGSAVSTSALLSAHDGNRLGPSGTNALHLAVWRNQLELVQRLLAASTHPDVADAESGWSALHRALYFGNLRIAGALLAANASLSLADWHGRSPLDLLSVELRGLIPPEGPGEVYSWGNGSNYTLGTGSTRAQLAPARLDGLHSAAIVALAASKFHSAAVGADGALFTWGWGRGGRLGHPEAHIHSGESAVILPRLVTSLGRRKVAAVAAGKHHTLLCTAAGEAFSMGSNRHGQLGYLAGDTQAEPRRIGALRAQRVVAVAAANKHSVAVTSAGDIFTWGSNALGQLGYGTFDSTSSAAPRLVEAMKGRAVAAAAAAKRHTIVLTASGDVFTWGHRGVSPRRVLLAGARDAANSAGQPLRFHRGHADVVRPEVAAICAGAAHSSALTMAGAVLTWRSADPTLAVQEVVGGGLGGRRVVAVAAGKYRTAAVTEEGDVYSWEGRSDFFPAEGRQSGSGSKKSSRAKGTPIPGAAGGGASGRLTGVSPSTAPAGRLNGGSPGSWGSPAPRCAHNQQHAAAGSDFERAYVQRKGEREGSSLGPTGSALGLGGRSDTPRSAARAAAAAADVFEGIQPQRVEGLKRVGAVAVGEKHSLALQRWGAAQLEGLPPIPWLAPEANVEARAGGREDGGDFQLASPRELEAETSTDSLVASPGRVASPLRLRSGRIPASPSAAGPPSLQHICEEAVARELVDPRTALQVLEYADVAGATVLRAYCLAVAACNLDAVLLEAGGAFEELPPHLLAELEAVYQQRLSGVKAGTAGADAPPTGQEASTSASADAGAHGAAGGRGREREGSKLQPGRRPTAAPPHFGDALAAASEAGGAAAAAAESPRGSLPRLRGESSFKDLTAIVEEAAGQRLRRSLLKKLQQIERLEERAAAGAALDAQQAAKVAQRPAVASALAALDGGLPPDDVDAMLHSSKAAAELAAWGRSPPQGSSRARCGGKGKARKRTQSESTVLASELSTITLVGPDQPSSSPSGSAVAHSQPMGSASFSASVAGRPPPPLNTLTLVPAFGGQATTHVVGFAASSTGKPSTGAGDGGTCALRSGGRPRERPVRKGGLSMFLRGDLDSGSGQADQPPASAAAATAPAWGGKPAAPATPTSLRDILGRQKPGQTRQQRPVSPAPGSSAAKAAHPAGAAGEAPSPGAAPATRMSLASFMQATSPLAIRRDAEQGSTAVWGGVAGASPPLAPPSQRSFKEIQEEQERRRQAATPPAYGASPPTTSRPPLPGGSRPPPTAQTAAGGAPCAAAIMGSSPLGLLGTSPSGRSAFKAAPVPQQSKWYVPEDEELQQRRKKSLKDIQTEESAMKELARRYGSANVRIGKPALDAAPPPRLPPRAA